MTVVCRAGLCLQTYFCNSDSGRLGQRFRLSDMAHTEIETALFEPIGT